MQHKHRRVRRRVVDLVQRGHPSFCKLEFRPSADDPHPLRRGRVGGLPAQHRQGVRDRWHVFPAQLHIVVQTAADHMGVAVVQTGDHPAPPKVDDLLHIIAMQPHHICIRANSGHLAVNDCDRRGVGRVGIKRGDLAVSQNECGVGHGLFLCAGKSGMDQAKGRGGPQTRQHGATACGHDVLQLQKIGPPKHAPRQPE